MPIYIFTCENEHREEVFRKSPFKRTTRRRCKKCGLYARRDYSAEHSKRGPSLNLNYEKDPISYLTKKRSFKGIWIEALTPQPVFVRSERQYNKLLKDSHSREKPS